MARRYVDDDATLYRVVLTTKRHMPNPDYDWRSTDPAKRRNYLLSDTQKETTFYGPYMSKGAAKGQATTHVQDGYGNPRDDVLGVHVEKAHIVWEVVPDARK